ncbi:MAG: hypothetical protein AB1390_01035 [Nitrospirota bacterium]
MKIDCFLSPGCASEEALRNNIKRALTLEHVEAEVNFRRIAEKEAEHLNLRGSPSILINGNDIQPVDMQGFS